MATWYYNANGQQFGPVEEHQVRAMVANGQIQPQDAVWREGMAQWTTAAEAGLMAAQAVRPMPAQSVRPMPAQAVPTAAMAPAHGAAPVLLSYAAPTISAMPVIGHDEGPFIKVGKQFTVPGGRWVGMTVASPKAFYLLKVSQATSGAAYGIGGIAGVMLQKAFAKPDDTRTCDLNDLPHPIRSALDPKGKRKKGDVIVLPKEAIRLVKVGSVSGVVGVHLGAEKFNCNAGMFGKSKVRSFLTGTGWAINQEVVPTAAPIHGHGFGRQFHELDANKPSTTKRVIFAIIGILIIVLYILARFGSAMR